MGQTHTYHNVQLVHMALKVLYVYIQHSLLSDFGATYVVTVLKKYVQS